MRWLFLLLVVTGCSTPVKHPSITPPPIKRAKVAEVPMPPTRTTFTLRWEDCAPQPSNVWYRVYEVIDFKTRRLYAELTNAYELAIPMTNAAGFFTLEATDGTKSRAMTKECL